MSNRAGLVLVAVLPIVFGAPRFSHADPTVLSICVNPGGAIRAVDPSEACPRNHTKVSVPLGAQAQLDFYTVARPAETFGPLTIAGVSVSCDEGDQVVGGGYFHTKDQPDLQVSGSAPEGERSWIVQVQNFSATLSYQLVLFARCARLSPSS